jgi:hypothetical protein
MKSVQELVVAGKVPGDTRAAENQQGYPNGWPLFSDISKQVAYDWNNLPSDRVRVLKSAPDYKAALDAFLLEPATPVTVTDVPTITLAPSPEEQIVDTTPPPAGEVVPPAPASATDPVVEDEPEGTKSGPFVKVKGGWEARVEAIDGSGVQVYKGKTKDEVSAKLIQAQQHATAKIRQQEEERQRLLAEEPADLAPVRKRLAPRKLTADEQFEFAEAMSSGDPTKINRAMAKRDEIILGGPVEEVVGQVNETRDALEFESYKATAKSFMKQNPDVAFTKQLGDDIDAILSENNWAYTVRNLNKALAQLTTEGKITSKVSTPATEEDLPIPTSSREAAPVVVPPAPPAATVPAARPTPPSSAAQGEGRLRPGSASTGVSPRQASVRHGATPQQTVGLTAEEYNRMSVSDTRRKYKTDPGFRSAVDKLIAEGKI